MVCIVCGVYSVWCTVCGVYSVWCVIIIILCSGDNTILGVVSDSVLFNDAHTREGWSQNKQALAAIHFSVNSLKGRLVNSICLLYMYSP